MSELVPHLVDSPAASFLAASLLVLAGVALRSFSGALARALAAVAPAGRGR